MHLFSLMGTVLTNVIMRTPAPSWMVMAEEEGSIAFAVTGTDSTAVHSHSLLTGLLWMLHRQKKAGSGQTPQGSGVRVRQQKGFSNRVVGVG